MSRSSARVGQDPEARLAQHAKSQRLDAASDPLARLGDDARLLAIALDAEVVEHRPRGRDRAARARARCRRRGHAAGRPVVELEDLVRALRLVAVEERGRALRGVAVLVQIGGDRAHAGQLEVEARERDAVHAARTGRSSRRRRRPRAARRRARAPAPTAPRSGRSGRTGSTAPSRRASACRRPLRAPWPPGPRAGPQRPARARSGARDRRRPCRRPGARSAAAPADRRGCRARAPRRGRS